MSTGISWTDEVWNPVVGCTKVSAGCKNCYAETLHTKRHKAYQSGSFPTAPAQYHEPFTTVQLKPERLEMPLRWRKPRRVFVNSVSDLFHEQVPNEFIAEVFGIMAGSPRHTFQVLTKRPERMPEWFAWAEEHWPDLFPFGMPEDEPIDANVVLQFLRPHLMAKISSDDFAAPWPLPNVHLGTSVEDQRAADERIPHLLRTPAAVRFLSCEPLIGPVDLLGDVENPGPAVTVEGYSYPTDYGTGIEYDAVLHVGIDWVIAGGESGPGHRPMKMDWMRSIRDQCQAAGVAFFGKQASGFRNEMPLPEDLQIRDFPDTSAGVTT